MTSMKKIISFLIFTLLCITVFFIPKKAQAIEYKPYPLDAYSCEDKDVECNLPTTSDEKMWTMKLMVKHKDDFGNDVPLPPANTPSFIVECFGAKPEDTTTGTNQDLSGEQYCTTGSTETDKQVFRDDHLTKVVLFLKNQHNQKSTEGTCMTKEGTTNWYVFKGLFTSSKEQVIFPFKTTEQQELTSVSDNGEYSLEWQSCSPPDEFYRTFTLISLVDNQSQQTSGSQETDLANGGLKQDNFAFTTNPTAAPTQQVKARPSRKSKLSRDPYGRLFDNETLEPVANAQVLLFKKREDGTFTPVDPKNKEDVPGTPILNPYETKQDGLFSFVLIDGTYKLSLPSDLNPNIALLTEETKLNPLAANIYTDIYPLNTGEEIIQLGNIQHRDIPVLISGSKNASPVKVVNYLYNLNKQNNVLDVTGTVSHLKTTVTAYSVKFDNKFNRVRGQPLATQLVDENGEFSFQIILRSIPKGEFFGDLVMEKDKSFTTLTTSSATLPPILNYLEGIARNEKGTAIPNAKVGVYIVNSSVPYFETYADNKGYWQILSKNLPALAYTLSYTDPKGENVSLTTAQYLVQNSDYLTKEGINLNSTITTIKKEPKNSTSLSQSVALPKNLNNSNTSLTPTIQKKNTISANKTILIVMVIIVFVIVGIGVGAFLIKKGNTHQTPFQ